MVLLTSNGLSSKGLLESCRVNIRQGSKSAVIITTASPFKDKNKHIETIKNNVKALGLEPFLFDFDSDDVKELEKYDVMIINGGNPFYLLDRIRKHKAENKIRDYADNKLLIGISAGSIVLGTTLAFVNVFSPEMNDEVKLTDLSGLAIVTENIIPHYYRFQDKFDNFENRILAMEKQLGLKAIRLNDGQGYFYRTKKTIDKKLQRLTTYSLTPIIGFVLSLILLFYVDYKYQKPDEWVGWYYLVIPILFFVVIQVYFTYKLIKYRNHMDLAKNQMLNNAIEISFNMDVIKKVYVFNARIWVRTLIVIPLLALFIGLFVNSTHELWLILINITLLYYVFSFNLRTVLLNNDCMVVKLRNSYIVYYEDIDGYQTFKGFTYIYTKQLELYKIKNNKYILSMLHKHVVNEENKL